MAEKPEARWRLPRITSSVFTDLAIWMVGLGLTTGAVFPFLVVVLGVPEGQALSVRFFGATLTAGLLVGGLNFLLARAVVGARLRLLAERTRYAGDMVSYATDSGDWSACDPDRCAIPVDSRDEIGDSAIAFNRLIDALGRSHAVEAAIRDLFEALSSHLQLDALSEVALQRVLEHSGAGSGAVLVDLEHGLQVTAAVALPAADRLAGGPDVLAALGTGEPRLLDDPDGPLMVTPLIFEQRALGCVILPPPPDSSSARLTDLFARAFAVAVNNALTHASSERLAAFDALTGAANRRTGLQVLESEIARARRTLSGLSVLMIDLDHFKRINDVHGHLAGDRVLGLSATSIQATLREYDTLLRYGGEEFLVILPGVAAHEAGEIAERVRQAIAVESADSGLPVTASVGWASLDSDESLTELLERADRAMYRAKTGGRNRVCSPGAAAV